MQPNIGLIYGTTTGTTERIAHQIQQTWQAQSGLTLPMFDIAYVEELSMLLDFDMLIVGVPTWKVGELQCDWLDVFPALDTLNLWGKRVAMFGLGDQYNFEKNFQDALGILGRKFRACGADLIGFTSTKGYKFETSLGVENGQFMGLAIDDRHQPDQNDIRIESWVTQLITRTRAVPA